LARTVPIRKFPILKISEQEDLEEILNDLYLELSPNGRIEVMLIERIANCYFQLTRVARCQTAHVEIAMRKEFCEPSVDLGHRLDQLRGKRNLAERSMIVLRRTFDILETEHFLDTAAMSDLEEIVVNPNYAFRLSHLNAQLKESKGETGKQKSGLAVALTDEFLRTLHLALTERRDMSESLESWNDALQYSRFNQHLVPEEGILRNLQRYESMLDRQLHRALVRLQDIQRVRLMT
jgi:hypothetical protein